MKGLCSECETMHFAAEACPTMVFKIRHEKRGGHIWCRLFAAKAPNMTYAGCGDFCVREEEFEDLQRVMSGIQFQAVENEQAS